MQKCFICSYIYAVTILSVALIYNQEYQHGNEIKPDCLIFIGSLRTFVNITKLRMLYQDYVVRSSIFSLGKRDGKQTLVNKTNVLGTYNVIEGVHVLACNYINCGQVQIKLFTQMNQCRALPTLIRRPLHEQNFGGKRFKKYLTLKYKVDSLLHNTARSRKLYYLYIPNEFFYELYVC